MTKPEVVLESLHAPQPARQVALPAPPVIPQGAPQLSAAQWGVLAFLLSEVALFSTLIVTYIALLGPDRVGPTPAEALKLPLVLCTTVLLLSSSVSIHLAQHALRRGGRTAFCAWWAATIALGFAFLCGTGYEWHGLVREYHLTPSRNLFGSAYYTLVGFHALHVTAGVITMAIVLGLVLRRTGIERKGEGVELVAWYWHFVDAVWVVVFTVVYVVGR
jgi:cytochrome c oxidase subunit 3/cytochrome o ubiquinol oxidase subunit 3